MRLLAAVLAVLPGLLAWWWGRRLIPLVNDAALPERLVEYRRRLSQVTAVLAVMALFMTPDHWLWILVLLLGASLVGGFPARKALYRESWGLFSYLSYTLRFTFGLAGFWLLLLFAPMIVHAAGTLQWLTALVLATLLFLWNAYFPEILLKLVGATVLERSDLDSRFGAVLARSPIARPRLYRTGSPGGRWANALALPSRRGSAVLFMDTLLELLDPDEIAAIFAHEVAHLEHYNRRRLFWLSLFNWTAIAFAAFVVPLLMSRFEGYADVFGLGGIAIVAAVLLLRAIRHKAHEAESDRRAVSLCGDPETLARALEKLHVIGLIPRRWAVDMERKATHPSLAQRIRAIRATAGLEAGALNQPIVVGSRTPGRFVIFEADRVHWLEGAPPDTPLDPTTLHKRAATVRSVVYSELVDLRVRAILKGDASLVATDRAGHSWTVPLQPGEVASVQSALDVVDTRLTQRPSRMTHHPLLSILLAGAVFFLALFTVSLEVARNIWIILPMALIVLIRPGPAPLAALGVTAIGSALLALGQSGTIPLGAAFYLGSLAAMAVLGGLALWLAVTQVRGEEVKRTSGALLATGASGVAALLAWGVLLWAATVEPLAIRLHDAAQSTPSATLTLLGLAAALLVVPRRIAKWTALAATVLAVIPLILGSEWFLGRFGRDPLFAPTPLFKLEERSLSVIRQVHLKVYGVNLRLSPSGLWYAVRPEEGSHRGIFHFHVGNFSGALREIEAYKVEFLSDTDLLALVFSRSSPELRLIPVQSLEKVTWRRALPKIEVFDLSANPSTRMWRAVGLVPESSQLVLLSGIAGKDEIEEKRWSLPHSTDPYGFDYVTSSSAALGLKMDFRSRRPLRLSNFFFPGPVPVESEIWLLGPGGSRHLLTSALEARCLKPQVSGDTFVCLSYGGGQTLFWSLQPSDKAPNFLGSIDGRVWGGVVGPDGRFAVRGMRGGLMILDLPTGQAMRLKLPAGYESTFEFALTSGFLGGLSYRSNRTTITVYEVPKGKMER